MKLSPTIIATCLVLISNSSLANVNCPAEKVQNILVKPEKVLVQVEGRGWQVLAFNSDANFQEKVIMAKRAEKMGLALKLTYPNGYDKKCIIDDGAMSALNVKIKKPKKK